jgi:hypothetical protein
LTGSGAMIRIAFSPLLTAYPSRSQPLKPATNVGPRHRDQQLV